MANPELLKDFTPEQISNFEKLKAKFSPRKEPISTFPFTRDQMKEVVSIFSNDRFGREIKRNIDDGVECNIGGSKKSCNKVAIASIDFVGRIPDVSEEGRGIAGSYLFCDVHIEDGFKKIEFDFANLSTDYELGINGNTIEFLKEKISKP